MSGSLSSAEGELNAIIKEYLEYLKLEETLSTFENECQKKGKPIQEHAGRHDEKITQIQKQLMQLFNKGQRLEFFTFWDASINPDVIDHDLYVQKMEFMLHVYFAIYPLRKTDHWVQEDVEQAMYHFRYYLENRGSSLSGCSDVLPFFALPYVQQPASHPSFSHIFQDPWTTDLRNKLETFLWESLNKRLKQEVTFPRLVDFYNNNDFDLKETKNELSLLERRLEDSQKSYIHQSKKLDKLQTDCQQLMSTASLLITALESAVKGDIVDLDCVLSSCAEHFPDSYRLKTKENDVERVKIKEASNEQQFVISCHLQSFDEADCVAPPPAEFVLNFNKIRKDLCCGQERTQLLLLQALRWRLTKVDSWILKQKMLVNYIENDIFNLRENSSKQPKFVDAMRSFSAILRQSISRLLNTFSSFSRGREYLSRCPGILTALMDNLLTLGCKDNIIQDMTLGALQKLSMRSVCQILMVEAGIMEWLTETLQKSKVSDYALEYSVALLMNLCLCAMGKPRCEAIKEKLLLLLQDLLLLNNKNIIGYVNGALYSILSIPSIKRFAIDQNLDDTLSIAMGKSEEEVKKQLECIQELLHSDTESTPCSSAEDTEDEEDTELEPELDLDDPIVPLASESSGEVLLWKVYSLFNLDQVSSQKKNEITRQGKSITNNNNDDLCRSMQDNEDHLAVSCDVRSNSVPPISEYLPDPQSPSKVHSASEPVTPKLDMEATQLVRKIVGQSSTTLVEAAITPHPSSVNIKGLNVNEYYCAFSSRPKIPRTPELSDSKRNVHRCSSPTIDTMPSYDSSIVLRYHLTTSKDETG